MNLNSIPTSGNWNEIASFINNNFEKINTEILKLNSTRDEELLVLKGKMKAIEDNLAGITSSSNTSDIRNALIGIYNAIKSE